LDFVSWKYSKQEFDIVLLSHVLNENLSDIGKFISKAQFAAAQSGKTYIFERSNDHVTWERIKQNSSNLVLNNATANVEVGTDRLVIGNSPHLSNKKIISTQYLCIQMPFNKNFYSLIRLYFQAWIRQSPSLLTKIFTENAEYDEKPFQSSYKGINQIINYWKEFVLPQKNIKITIYNISYTGSSAFVTWQAEFSLPDGKFKQVRGVIIFFYDAIANKISRLEEYFRTNSLYPVDVTHEPAELAPLTARKPPKNSGAGFPLQGGL
jgi:hypothetical protein